MKWVKQNLIVIVSLCIFFVVLTAVCWLAHNVTGKLRGVEDGLAAKRTTLEEMRGNKPYPSTENANLLRKDRERLTKQYETLRDAVSKSEVKVPDRPDPIVFQRSLYQTWDRLQQSAANAGVGLPEKFTFGFSHYLNAAPCADAKGDECARRLRLLLKELLVVEKVTDILISNRVENILVVRRAEVEQNPGPDTLGAVTERESSSIYETLPFEFQFSCGTPNLREVLNGLSHSEYLFIIRSLTVSTEIIQGQSAATPAVNPLFAATMNSPSTTTRRRLVVTVDLALAEFRQSQKSN
jgi:hypothetical protein